MTTNNTKLTIDYFDVLNPLTKAEKTKWLAALRSGEYKQGKFMLCSVDRNEFCCLGTCNSILELQVEGTKSFLRDYAKAENIADYFLKLPRYIQIKLSDMNDAGYSFMAIADYIEANIPAVDEQ